MIIPVYQRNYDWSPTQCGQLVDDLVELAETNRTSHFFGSIVGKSEDAFRWVVIDGQQRLTTVSLLLLALSRLIDNKKIPCRDAGLGAKLRDSFLINDDDGVTATRFRLKPVKHDDEAYTRLFRDDLPDIESSTVTTNYRYLTQRLLATGLEAEELLAAIDGLQVMRLNLGQEDDPQRIFESLNSTGLALSEADKIRNLVLMDLPAAEQEKVYNDHWNRIEELVDYDTDPFFRWFLVSVLGRTPRRDQVFQEFKAYAARQGTSGARLLAPVTEFARNYHDILQSTTGFPAIDRRLKRLNILKQDVVLPFLVPLIGDVRSGTITEKDFLDCLAITESYLFRRFTCNLATNSLNKTFATIYREVKKHLSDTTSAADILAWSLLRREGSARFPGDKEFAADFTTRNFYKMQAERRRYLFECLENGTSKDTTDIAGRLAAGELTIEHIMPQTLTSAWREQLGPDAEDIHATWVHRIANLTVTGYNPEYSNLPFEMKKAGESGFAHTPYRLNRFVNECDSWGSTQLQQRAERLSAQAVAYWALPTTTFVPPAPELDRIPLGTDNDFTNRTPVAWSFEDSGEPVSTWVEVLSGVLRQITLDHPDEMRRYVEAGIDPAIRPADAAASNSSCSPIGAGAVVHHASSTAVKTLVLRRVFEFMGLDPEELVISLRPVKTDNTSYRTYTGPYADLAAMLPVIEDAAGCGDDPAETDRLRAKLREKFQPHRTADPARALGRPLVSFTADDTAVNTASAPQLLAIIQLLLDQERILDPAIVHRSIIDGSLARWITLLADSNRRGSPTPGARP
ncbi:DUF262 domain-containing protein [Corynebacterium sp. CCM 8862]|uniref:DUF262 domain-containing protein n=1 Tax=Corynebacterium mendelii TaxID=2765362 RepID=A0A939ITT0_9CORY|nr:DUF262 domain-containing protein [Corynebacterium mendelii]